MPACSSSIRLLKRWLTGFDVFNFHLSMVPPSSTVDKYILKMSEDNIDKYQLMLELEWGSDKENSTGLINEYRFSQFTLGRRRFLCMCACSSPVHNPACVAGAVYCSREGLELFSRASTHVVPYMDVVCHN